MKHFLGTIFLAALIGCGADLRTAADDSTAQSAKAGARSEDPPANSKPPPVPEPLRIEVVEAGLAVETVGETAYRHIVGPNDKSPVGEGSALFAHGKTLLAGSESGILQLDPGSATATLHKLPAGTTIYRICRFDGHFYGVGPGPPVRFQLP